MSNPKLRSIRKTALGKRPSTTEQAVISDENYKMLFNHLVDEVHLWRLVRDDSGQIMTWQLIDANPSALESWNKKKEEVLGKLTDEIFGPGTTALFMQTVLEIFQSGKPKKWVEYFEPTKQYLSMTSVPMGEFFISTGRDITETIVAKKQLENLNDNLENLVEERTKEIRQVSEELNLYRLAAEHAQSGVWYYDLTKDELRWDDIMYKLYGIQEDTFSGAFEAWENGLHPDDKERCVQELNDAISGKRPFDTLFRVVQPKTGEINYIRAKGQVKRSEDGKAVAVFGNKWDVTKEMLLSLEREEALSRLKSAQSQLVLSEKMASLGLLTAGVAHEINNPLNYIVGGYTAILESLKENPSVNQEEIEEYVGWIKAGADRATEIVKSLNLFSRNSDKADENCEVHAILDDCLLILQNKYKGKITIHKDYACPDSVVKGNEGRLHQIFLNIFSNAIDAIHEKGEIRITTQDIQDGIRIDIQDSGQGIAPEDLNKVMEPFFTTKSPGKGTGLGLSITKSIIDEHKGELSLKSTLGSGTTFSITLPRTRSV